MNRKNFFKNLLNAGAATVIGSKLDFIPTPLELPKPNFIGLGIWEQLEKTYRPIRITNFRGTFYVGDVIFCALDKTIQYYVYEVKDDITKARPVKGGQEVWFTKENNMRLAFSTTQNC